MKIIKLIKLYEKQSKVVNTVKTQLYHCFQVKKIVYIAVLLHAISDRALTERDNSSLFGTYQAFCLRVILFKMKLC